MIIIGAVLLVIAIVCIILGVALTAVKFLLWVGVGLVVVGVGALLYERYSKRKLP